MGPTSSVTNVTRCRRSARIAPKAIGYPEISTHFFIFSALSALSSLSLSLTVVRIDVSRIGSVPGFPHSLSYIYRFPVSICETDKLSTRQPRYPYNCAKRSRESLSSSRKLNFRRNGNDEVPNVLVPRLNHLTFVYNFFADFV